MKTRITVTVVSGFIFIVCGCGPAKKQADTINNINLPQGQTNLENVQTALSEIKEKHQELATSLLQGAKDVQEDAQENVVLPVETTQTNENAIEFETDLRELETKTKVTTNLIHSDLELNIETDIVDNVSYKELKNLEKEIFELALKGHENGMDTSHLTRLKNLLEEINRTVKKIEKINVRSSVVDWHKSHLKSQIYDFFQSPEININIGGDAMELAEKFMAYENAEEKFEIFKKAHETFINTFHQDDVTDDFHNIRLKAFKFAEKVAGVDIFSFNKEEK
ncbi:MAG TPA: hypothetical protein VJB34_04235 [Bdellovibrionota bacterium]|nr:hypothetical protein [Bdellovibrionota bacterium]